MPMAILGWSGGVGNRGDLGDIPNTNEAYINCRSWVRGDGVGKGGWGEGGWGSMQKGKQLQDSHQVYIYMYSYLHLYIYVVGGLGGC